MRALSAVELLNAWEQGLTESSTRRALILLAAACPETPADALANLSIGQRDVRLLTLREWTFGSQLVSVANCGSCSERLEWTFTTADLRVTNEPAAVEDLSLEVDRYCIRFRLPNSVDLAAVTGFSDVALARHVLLERCISNAERHGQQISIKVLPAHVTDAVVEQMSEADPLADVQLTLYCPACDHRWQVSFDIVSFFWSEINAWAERTLKEVHRVASAYGWPEMDILTMTPWRRQFYLSLM